MSAKTRRFTRRLITAARTIARPLRYAALSGSNWDHVAAGRLIRTGDFLARVGGDDLLDGEKSWFGRHAKKAFIAATGKVPAMVWTQHTTTGRWIHVCIYGPIDEALYAGLRSYRGTQHLLPTEYARCAQTNSTITSVPAPWELTTRQEALEDRRYWQDRDDDRDYDPDPDD